ncbi:DNA starvation/stationary phase protection protein [Trinickia caryophylli]|uniref:Starvation-inducible DNA-binding protein n=2 Tax=Trinickia caryophylli TaxID=28094 RepID=A0A1X7GIU4_TRICW|nr:DNA starvation/stationary phase protection protein [Trinickia caryophylli]PMS09904.1 DNA starvation/stationary phase protection protein [Trinickia caryophylli]TRX14940.1 DNA starvation/stationary phase protection protein [Trinickia caryophylli]WQE14796.1 DNA starvation/stationary phase protection protein [Trinickia caryophylli]SMF70475.1 starvation-inducible DNA-binding protein [Trinickia caryophylli]GLU34997.1 DNA starvation/stationary phase protection protein [Trinickia caryophylli]
MSLGHSTANAVSGRPALGFDQEAISEISAQLNPLLADVFALYLKTKNFHWHMWGSHFRDYHLMLDEQGEQLFAITDDVAERVRKIGGTTLRSIGDIARHQRLADNDAVGLAPAQMLGDLRNDNLLLADLMLSAHAICEKHNDVATASLLENWIDEAQRRAWFLAEACR